MVLMVPPMLFKQNSGAALSAGQLNNLRRFSAESRSDRRGSSPLARPAAARRRRRTGRAPAALKTAARVSERLALDRVADAFSLLRSEEHTSELQSRSDLVCPLLP